MFIPWPLMARICASHGGSSRAGWKRGRGRAGCRVYNPALGSAGESRGGGALGHACLWGWGEERLPRDHFLSCPLPCTRGGGLGHHHVGVPARRGGWHPQTVLSSQVAPLEVGACPNCPPSPFRVETCCRPPVLCCRLSLMTVLAGGPQGGRRVLLTLGPRQASLSGTPWHPFPSPAPHGSLLSSKGARMS